MMRDRILMVAGVVNLAVAALLLAAFLCGHPAPVSGAMLGFTPTHTPPPTSTPAGSIPGGPTPAPGPEREPFPKEPLLTISKSASTSQVSPGGRVNYTIQVCNEGDAVAGDVVVSDKVPSETALLGASTSLGRVVTEGNGVRAELGPMLPGVCATISISTLVRPDVAPGTEIRNVGSVARIYDDAYVLVVGLLPQTGEPSSAPLAVMAGLVAIGLVLLVAGRMPRARLRPARQPVEHDR